MTKKEKIVEAATRVFIENGAAFSKLSEVAKRAKVPAPLIHYYFEDIEDLHYEIILRAYESLMFYAVTRVKDLPLSPVEMMREYAKGVLLWAEEKPEFMSLWMYFYYMASLSEKFRALDTKIRDTGRERIALMIYQGIESGDYHLKPQDSVKDLAHEIQAIISGQTITYATEAKTKPIDYYVQQTEHRIFQMLGVK